MGAFELNCNESEVGGAVESPPRKVREECIIALKVYDSCRQQDCLTDDELGPARAAEDVTIGDEVIREGEVIDPPDNAAAVTIDRVKVKKVIIVDKDPNPFRRGFWDIDLKFVFEYRLTFREADGSPIRPTNIRANSIFNKKVTLFGSEGSDITLSTDLFCERGRTNTIDSEPFILVEAKAMALAAELKFQRRRNITAEDLAPTPNRVNVTIGLFTIIKLFRIVNLSVESRGFCIPDECHEVSPLHPCDFFEDLDFPMDIFAPPQRREFLEGISNNIPSRNRDEDDDRRRDRDPREVGNAERDRDRSRRRDRPARSPRCP